jgi:hypothetical protein
MPRSRLPARAGRVFPAHSSGAMKSHKRAEYSNGHAWGKTTDPVEIERDFAKWPKANFGIATGPEAGIFVVEADCSKKEGRAPLASAVPPDFSCRSRFHSDKRIVRLLAIRFVECF